MANINKIRLSGQTYNIEDSNAPKTVELTQAQYDALTVKDPNTFYVITDAQGADLSNYYTKSETSGATEISTALNAKQDTLVSGTNIKTINNESILGSGNIDIQGGGGKAIEAGRGISVTTGETADTVSFNLPISAGTGTGSLIIGDNDGGTSYASVASARGAVVFPSRRFYGKNYATEESSFAHGSGCSAGTCSHAEGFNTKCVNGFNSHSEGQSTEARGGNSHSEGEGTFAGETYGINACHAEGFHTSAMTNYSHAEGYYTKTTNESEHSQGRYNVSNKANGTWGDSGNTLFSVGNGTADNARHNAFEIRQNGDIYLTKDGQDVKLQDQLGGGGGDVTVDTSLDSGSTNPVANSAITNTLYTAANANGDGNGYVGNIEAKDDTTYLDRLIWGFKATRYKRPLGGSNSNNTQGVNFYCSSINGVRTVSNNYQNVGHFSLVETSAITTSITSSSTDAQVPSAKAVYDAIQGGGMDDNTQQLIATSLVDLNDRKADKSLLEKYQKKGDYATKLELDAKANVLESELDAKANVSDVMTLEKSTNNELVTASALNNLNNKFGGLSLVKITESAYAALTNKDENVLYIVVADQS